MKVRRCVCGWPMLRAPHHSYPLLRCSRSGEAYGCDDDWQQWHARQQRELAHDRWRARFMGGLAPDEEPRRRVKRMRVLLRVWRQAKQDQCER